MKKFISLMLAAVLLIGIVGCGGSADQGAEATTEAQTEAAN